MALFVEITLDSVSQTATGATIGVTYRLKNDAKATLATATKTFARTQGDLEPDVGSLAKSVGNDALTWAQYMVSLNALTGAIGGKETIPFQP
jgi:hypothetical protein